MAVHDLRGCSQLGDALGGGDDAEEKRAQPIKRDRLAEIGSGGRGKPPAVPVLPGRRMAAKSVENLSDRVGCVTVWGKLGMFQKANPGRGERAP